MPLLLPMIKRYSSVADGSDVCSVGIFNSTVEELKTIMDKDSGVKTGVFIYELHSYRSFLGLSFPK